MSAPGPEIDSHRKVEMSEHFIDVAGPKGGAKPEAGMHENLGRIGDS